MSFCTNTKDKTAPSISCRLRHKKIKRKVNLQSLSDVFASMPQAVILGANPSCDRFSYWVAQPIEHCRLTNEERPLEKLGASLRKYKVEDCSAELPDDICVPGWMGYLSYDLNRFIDNVTEAPTDDLQLPLADLNFYDKSICYDHKEEVFYLLALEFQGQTKVNDKFALLEDMLNRAAKTKVEKFKAISENVDAEKPTCNMTRDYYLDSVRQILDEIYDGNVYQVNFSRRMSLPYSGPAVRLFHWQNQYNPSPYAAYIDGGDYQLVSASPELFIKIVGRNISTQPIKGTRKRLPPQNEKAQRQNACNYDDLLNSPKEQAELNMIIDLERNDIARITVPGTRTVSQPRTIVEYPSVFHALATISGHLRPDLPVEEILRAVFPGGSITGAPKLSSMQIINRLEPTARGPYTGSIGVFGVNGNVCLNIAIRTIIIKARNAYVQTGGGIVADSRPQDEWEETNVKAKALLAGIAAVNEYNS